MRTRMRLERKHKDVKRRQGGLDAGPSLCLKGGKGGARGGADSGGRGWVELGAGQTGDASPCRDQLGRKRWRSQLNCPVRCVLFLHASAGIFLLQS